MTKRTAFAPPALALPAALLLGSAGAGPEASARLGPDPAVAEVGPQRTAPAVEQAAVDFNHPPRDYVAHRLNGWDVLVERSLEDEAPGLAGVALARLDADLGKLAKALPAKALADLRRVRVFLLHGARAKGGGRESGLEYFRGDAPRHHAWLDPRMASSIAIFDAGNYAALDPLWASKSLMHEFGHAQHLEHGSENRADIFHAWRAAIDAGLYATVRAEDRGTHNPNYAARNHLEYFAELSATYFVGNTYFPRDRAALKAHDPAGYALVETLWGLRDGGGKPEAGPRP